MIIQDSPLSRNEFTSLLMMDVAEYLTGVSFTFNPRIP